MLPGKNAPTHIAASGCQLPKAWSRSSVFSLLCSSPAHSHRHFQLGELRPAALTRANNPGDTQGNPPQALPCHRPATWFVGAKNRGGGSVFVLGATRPPVAGASRQALCRCLHGSSRSSRSLQGSSLSVQRSSQSRSSRSLQGSSRSLQGRSWSSRSLQGSSRSVQGSSRSSHSLQGSGLLLRTPTVGQFTLATFEASLVGPSSQILRSA